MVRLYDRLFNHENPVGDKEADFIDSLNPESLVTLEGCWVEPSLAEPQSALPYQFEREGYFVHDEQATGEKGALVFNRTVTLRDSWTKISQNG